MWNMKNAAALGIVLVGGYLFDGGLLYGKIGNYAVSNIANWGSGLVNATSNLFGGS